MPRRYLWLLAALAITAAHAQTDAPITSSVGTNTGRVITLSTHWYRYEPKEDITAYELSVILKTILPGLTCRNVLSPSCDVLSAIEALPESSRRHFVKVDR